MTEVGTTGVSSLVRWGRGYELSSTWGGDGFGNSEWAGGSECEQLVAFCGVLTNEFCWAVLGVDTKSALISPLSSPSQPSPREPQTSAERAC